MKNVWTTMGIRGRLEWYKEDGQWCVSRASSPLTFGKGSTRDEALADLFPSYRNRLKENYIACLDANRQSVSLAG